jgi:hypothetical protein
LAVCRVALALIRQSKGAQNEEEEGEEEEREEETYLGGEGWTLGGPRRNQMVFGGQMWGFTASVFIRLHDL